jgi:diguanylate cyclase (GGDEF)-like protein
VDHVKSRAGATRHDGALQDQVGATVMISPYFYIVFSLMVSSAVLSVTFYIAWRNFGRRPHALTWAIAFFVGVLQFSTTLNAYQFPSESVYLLFENAFAITLITLGLRGHCQRTRCAWMPQNLVPIAFAIYAVTVWFAIFEPHAGMVRGIAPLYAAVTLALSAYLIVSYREHTRPSEWAAAISIVLFAISQLVASGLALAQGAEHQPALFDKFMHFTYITLPAGYMSTSILIILMMASDISEKMKEIAIRDSLTGLLNRRGFNDYGEKAFAAARRGGTELSVVMTDIDRFKFINDRFGHAAGDVALAHFADLFSAERRKEDIVARVGGEEFALLLPGTELRDAMALADQLCRKVGATPLDLTSVGLPITASFGVAAISESDTTLDDMIRRADRALYRSKRAGRNQVDLESSQLMLAADGTLRPVESG